MATIDRASRRSALRGDLVLAFYEHGSQSQRIALKSLVSGHSSAALDSHDFRIRSRFLHARDPTFARSHSQRSLDERRNMTTLYDLLGALPGADADDLRDAFRQAVKGVHPDISPNDPDAALKFRLIVYAMEVLRDPEQRAAYDHLLELARQELVSQRIAAKIRNFAFAMISLASVSMMAVGLYLLFAPMFAVPPQVRQTDEPSGTSPETGSSSLSARPDLNDNGATARSDAETKKPVEKQDDFLTRWGADDINAKTDRRAETATPAEPPRDAPPHSDAIDNNAPADRNAATAMPAEPPRDAPPHSDTTDNNAPADRNAAIATATPAEPPKDHPPEPSLNDNKAPADRNAETAPAMKEQETPVAPPSVPPPPAPHDDADDVKALIEPYDETDASAVMHAKGIVAYRKGDLKLALADLNRAIELNPTFMMAYINRGIVLYRMGQLDLALADVARAQRIDRASRTKSAAALHRKRRHDASVIESPDLMQEAGQ
jgi:curved DNA-binding protein CbpA